MKASLTGVQAINWFAFAEESYIVPRIALASVLITCENATGATGFEIIERIMRETVNSEADRDP